MDRVEFVRRRRGKYLAQTLESFETLIEPYLGPDRQGAIQDFKGLVRARFNALTTDATEIMALDSEDLNGAAVDLRDRLSPTGRP